MREEKSSFVYRRSFGIRSIGWAGPVTAPAAATSSTLFASSAASASVAASFCVLAAAAADWLASSTGLRMLSSDFVEPALLAAAGPIDADGPQYFQGGHLSPKRVRRPRGLMTSWAMLLVPSLSVAGGRLAGGDVLVSPVGVTGKTLSSLTLLSVSLTSEPLCSDNSSSFSSARRVFRTCSIAWSASACDDNGITATSVMA